MPCDEQRQTFGLAAKFVPGLQCIAVVAYCHHCQLSSSSPVAIGSGAAAPTEQHFLLSNTFATRLRQATEALLITDSSSRDIAPRIKQPLNGTANTGRINMHAAWGPSICALVD